jgi:translation initiation factor 1
MGRGGGDRTVWSSERGDLRGEERSAERSPRRERRDALPNDGVVRVGREVQGRKGKGVTTITGVPLPPPALRDLAAELKRRCGTGGTVEAGVIELQGDHRDQVIPLLEARGWVVRRAGG